MFLGEYDIINSWSLLVLELLSHDATVWVLTNSSSCKHTRDTGYCKPYNFLEKLFLLVEFR